MDDVVAEGNCNHSLSQKDKNTLICVSGSVAIFSGLCCVLALVAVCVKRLYRQCIYRLAMYQVTVSLLQSCSLSLRFILIDYDEEKLHHHASCRATAFLGQYFVMMNLSFISWLTFHLFCYVVFFKNMKKLEWLYVSASILVPLLVACVPFTTDSYGPSGAWCYIRSVRHTNCSGEPDPVGVTEQFTLYYGPAALMLILNIIAIVVMTIAIMHRSKMTRKKYKCSRSSTSGVLKEQLLRVEGSSQRQYTMILKQILPLLAYPIIYFALFLAAFSNRLYTATQGSTSFGTSVAHAATQSLKGFFVGATLIIHVTIIHFKRAVRVESDHAHATYIDATPCTSGAVTAFSLPNETDIEIKNIL